MDDKFNLLQLDTTSALPLTNQLAQRLTWMIASGLVTEGETLPNIREMGQFLGVHMHTVRSAYHILEDKGRVSVKPRAGTIVLPYTPFLSQEKARLALSGQIAVLIPAMSPFYDNIFKGIQAAAEPQRLLPLAIPCGEDPHRAEGVYSNISAGNFSGVINISVGFSDDFYDDFLGEKYLSVPLIFVDDFSARTHRVLFDTMDAVNQGTQHLIQHGYTDIALLNCPRDWPVGIEVFKGFSAALKAHGIQPAQAKEFTAPDFSFEAGVFCSQQLLAGNSLPRAIIAASDTLALAAISAIKKHGLRVPQDIAVIGFNDIPASNITEPPLTTIALPTYDVGFQAMRSLMKIMNNTVKTWEQHHFPGNLIIRQSCGCDERIRREE